MMYLITFPPVSVFLTEYKLLSLLTKTVSKSRWVPAEVFSFLDDGSLGKSISGFYPPAVSVKLLE